MVAKLREIRKARGMTQTELSKVTGIHRTTINRYEKVGVDPKIETAEKLAKALGVTVNELIERTEDG